MAHPHSYVSKAFEEGNGLLVTKDDKSFSGKHANLFSTAEDFKNPSSNCTVLLEWYYQKNQRGFYEYLLETRNFSTIKCLTICIFSRK
jgi:hypothetical protein